VAKILNLQFKLFVILAIVLTLWGIGVLIAAWVQQPSRLSSPGQGHSDSFVLILSFFLTMLGGWFLTNEGLSLKRHRGYGLLIQAYRETNQAKHQQVKDVMRLKSIGFALLLGGLLLGNTWQSGFYLLYTIAAFVYLLGMWRQADLSDRLAQNR
jgi:hypothetical protein